MAICEYILTQDIGSYLCKAVLFAFDGTVVRSNTVSYLPNQNERGWFSQSPELWWRAFCQNCRTLLAGIPAESVKAVSLCGQMMCCLPVDKEIHPIYDCITWDDRRSIKQAIEIDEILGAATIHTITGTRLGYAFTLPKVLWLKKFHPEIYEKTYKFIQCKDYINYRLCNQLVTDFTDAGFTQMYDLYGGHWSDTILRSLDIDSNKLPEIVASGTILGTITPEASVQCGLKTSTLVIQGLGDGRAPSVGSGLQRPGEGCINLGSSSWVSQVTTQTNLDTQHSITKAYYPLNGLYVNGGTVLSGRHCVNWYANNFISDYNSSKKPEDFLPNIIPLSPVGSKGLLFMPYLRGERAPNWNNFARGGFIGLSTQHNRYDFCRSILEGVSFQLCTIRNCIEKLEHFTSMSLVGNGCSPYWQQILSDVFEMEIKSSDVTDNVGCVGVALIAGLAVGAYQDYSEISRFHHNHFITNPIEENMDIYRELLPAFEDCYLALQDINQHLSSVNQNKINKPLAQLHEVEF